MATAEQFAPTVRDDCMHMVWHHDVRPKRDPLAPSARQQQQLALDDRAKRTTLLSLISPNTLRRLWVQIVM
jgi:hypothetical protein